jgi:hypothetical protein
MGNLCDKTKFQNEIIVKENGAILKKCREPEIKFWDELKNLNLTIVSSINNSKRTIEFNYPNLFLENYISIGQIVEYLIVEQNFFYFFTFYEILIAMIDFLQIIFGLKRKYGITQIIFS